MPILLEELYKTLEKKDNEIAMLKQEITNLKTTNNNQQQTLSDLSLKQLEIEESIKHLQSEHKNEREKSKKLAVKEIAAAKSTSPDKETQPPPTHTILNCTIPTANRFEPLSETNTPPTSNTPTKENTSPNTPPTENPINTPSPTEEPTNTQPTNKKLVNAETIILCDSNGRDLKPSVLCPDTPTYYIRCPTLTNGINIINEIQFPKAKTFIIHCGTNDLEQIDASQILVKLKTLENQLHKKYPQSR
ncbi:Hypothetical predicted protein, partial [Paramuricea clavata]